MDNESHRSKKRHGSHHLKIRNAHAHFQDDLNPKEQSSHSPSSPSSSYSYRGSSRHRQQRSSNSYHGGGRSASITSASSAGRRSHGQSGFKTTRKSIKRRVAETYLGQGNHERDRTLSFSSPQSHRHSYGSNKDDNISSVPSVNPVRKSIMAKPSNSHELIVHYNRYLNSHQTVDSRHELFYKSRGFPKMPRYNKSGRRFTDSSDTDPDYDRKEFKKLSEALNAPRDDSSDDYGYGRRNRIYPETSRRGNDSFFGCIRKLQSLLCSCCVCCYKKKEPAPVADAPPPPPAAAAPPPKRASMRQRKSFKRR